MTATPRCPGSHPRRVFLAVSGLSPQVVTETLYALAVAAPPDQRFVPTEVQVLTTAVGARLVRETLLGAQGAFARLRAHYGVPDIRFGSSDVHEVCQADGQALEDIRTAADNACMADAVTERVRRLTADPDCALHVSIAGGRKTMGYYAGYALSLFGREQDRLSHVLVSPPFESAPRFFYPTPTPQSVPLRDGGAADAATAEVQLAVIPFVRLRQGVPRALLDGRSSFAAVVQAANASAAPPHLRLDVARCALQADTVTIPLSPTQFALMAALAQRARTGKPPLPAPLRDAHDAAWADEVLRDLRAAVGVMRVSSRMEASLRADCSGNKLSPHFSRLRERLRDHLAPGRDALYFDDGAARPRRYRVPLPPQSIELVRP